MNRRMVTREEHVVHWHWDEVQLEEPSTFPTEEPQNPEIGAGWHDPETDCLCVWDGVEWVCMPMD